MNKMADNNIRIDDDALKALKAAKKKMEEELGITISYSKIIKFNIDKPPVFIKKVVNRKKDEGFTDVFGEELGGEGFDII